MIKHFRTNYSFDAEQSLRFDQAFLALGVVPYATLKVHLLKNIPTYIEKPIRQYFINNSQTDTEAGDPKRENQLKKTLADAKRVQAAETSIAHLAANASIKTYRDKLLRSIEDVPTRCSRQENEEGASILINWYASVNII